VAEYNPLTQVVEAMRQGFVGESLTWSETWPGVVVIAGLVVLLGAFALRNMGRTSY
jgi:ABC-type polysaccharide/polyol phosphate export permease